MSNRYTDRHCRNVRKTAPGAAYLWRPDCRFAVNDLRSNEATKSCTAVANGNGEDFIVKYVYTSTYDRLNKEHREAYVECGYVE